jgi:hypothetical protein
MDINKTHTSLWNLFGPRDVQRPTKLKSGISNGLISDLRFVLGYLSHVINSVHKLAKRFSG